MKVTIYTTSDFGFGVHRTEAHLIEHGRRPYAQYKEAPFAVFTPKRKRKARGYQGGFKPYLLILEGWDTPGVGDGFTAPETLEGGITVRESRYTMCDDRYATDFDAAIDAHIEAGSVKVVGDYRFTNEAGVELYHGSVAR